MSTFFRDPHVASDLLAICQGEGWITPKIAQKARILIDHGLHPEQALLGTGLLTPDQYGEALTHIFDTPFVRAVSPLSPKRHPALLDATWFGTQRAKVIDEDKGSLLVAFADPSDRAALEKVTEALRSHGKELVCLVTLWSDIRPSDTVVLSAVSSSRRQAEHLLREASTSHIEIGHDSQGWRMAHESVQFLGSEIFLHPHAAASALMVHLHRQAKTGLDGWFLSHQATSHGSVLKLSRQKEQASAHHPLAWSQVLQSFLQDPRGVLVFLAPEEDARMQVERQEWLSSPEEAHWRTHAHLPALYRITNEEMQEEAVHAALSGRPVVAQQRGSDLAWIEPLEHARIPISILERHTVPNGMAWTSRSL